MAEQIRDVRAAVQQLGHLYIQYGQFCENETTAELKKFADQLVNDLLQGKAGDAMRDVISGALAPSFQKMGEFAIKLGNNVLKADEDMAKTDQGIKFG
jgi:hypothetical protein